MRMWLSGFDIKTMRYGAVITNGDYKVNGESDMLLKA